MTHIVYLTNECFLISTKKNVVLNLNNKICKVKIKNKNEWLYFKFTTETLTGFGGIRLQQDQFNNNKFYVTDELNKWHGINADGNFSKGRQVFVYN